MAAKKRGLGRGLDALISDSSLNAGNGSDRDENSIQMIRLTAIEPDPKQPRRNFDAERIEELAMSIKEKGLLEPILVRECQNPPHYEIIAGERRWRACRIAGLKEIPVIVREYDDQERVEISLIENLQREDLNPIEEACAYQRLSEEFHQTQEEIARKVSKNRTSIANSMRLLKLPEAIQEMLSDGSLSMGQARALISLNDEELQIQIANRIVEENLSVREVEKLIRDLAAEGAEKEKPTSEKDPSRNEENSSEKSALLEKTYQNISEKLQEALGMKVHIRSKGQTGGRVEITFTGGDDLEKIMDRLMQ